MEKNTVTTGMGNRPPQVKGMCISDEVERMVLYERIDDVLYLLDDDESQLIAALFCLVKNSLPTTLEDYAKSRGLERFEVEALCARAFKRFVKFSTHIWEEIE
ncbi:MAG: hypothetical protein FWB92_06460 [Oscillospiraceae bacterium]|nr:hypothetical protein [Oscillospiraceae bacterium]